MLLGEFIKSASWYVHKDSTEIIGLTTDSILRPLKGNGIIQKPTTLSSGSIPKTEARSITPYAFLNDRSPSYY